MTTTHHVYGTTDDDHHHIKDDSDAPLYPWLDDSQSQPLDQSQLLDDRHSLDTPLDLHEDDLTCYRSPPFREADLPSASASTSIHALTELEGLEVPLPVPPPRAGGFGYDDDDDDSNWMKEEDMGHTRSPTLPRWVFSLCR